MKFVLQKYIAFTLIELMVVISIMLILATIVYTGLNPGRQYAQSRNSQRQVDVTGISTAISNYRLEHNGVIPTGISSTPVNASTLSTTLVSTYLPSIPLDPKTGDYQVSSDANNRVTVSAPGAELSLVISITQ